MSQEDEEYEIFGVESYFSFKTKVKVPCVTYQTVNSRSVPKTKTIRL